MHQTYYGFLYGRKDIETIIGVLPGTVKTAVDLKRSLNCKLVLLAVTKPGENEEELKNEVYNLSTEADEVWSVGKDIFSQYQDIFTSHGNSSSKPINHKEVMLKPYIEHMIPTPLRQPFAKQRGGIRKIVSVWNKGYPYNYKGKTMHSGKSSLYDFHQFQTALHRINETALKQHEQTIQWNVHGLKDQDTLIKEIEGEHKQLAALKDVESLDKLSWKGCLAFVIPDFHEDSFNFVALTTIWLGSPTIVTSESSVGKLLLTLPCPSKTKAVITLPSNANRESCIASWEEKIYADILNEKANPVAWAKELSEYLLNNGEIWNWNLAILDEQMVYGSQSLRQNRSDPSKYTNLTSTSNEASPMVICLIYFHSIYETLSLKIFL